MPDLLEGWNVILTAVFENRVLRRTFGPKRYK
jgi:hypothetical protein